MRIRKRLLHLSSSIPSTPSFSSDPPQPHRSEAAQPSDHLSDPPNQITAMDGETWKKEEEMKIAGDDIRRIINLSDGEIPATKILHPSSSSNQGSLGEGEHKVVVPLKKRKGSFDRNPNEEKKLSAKMKSKTNKKCGHDITLQVDDEKTMKDNENGINIDDAKKSTNNKRGNVIMEGSRCSRVNGRGWRCCQPTLVGYSLCEHHLGKGRLRSMASARRRGEGSALQPLMVVTKKRTKVGVVKARSMSSLLSQS